MNTSFYSAGMSRSSTGFAGRALIGVFAALAVLLVLQARLLWNSARQATPKSNSIAQTMQPRLNGLSMGIKTYLQNHDSLSLESIQSEGKEASRLLSQYTEEVQGAGNARAISRLEKAHEELRGATFTLLGTDHDQIKKREALAVSGQALLSVLNAAPRRRAVLAASAEAKNFTENSGDLSARLASPERFHRAVDAYAALSHTRKADRWAKEAGALFDQCVQQTRELGQAEAETRAELARYEQKRNVLDMVLQESRGDGVAGLHLGSLQKVFAPGMVYIILVGMLLAGGVALVVRSGLVADRSPAETLRNLVNCVEAAATGDMTRLPAEGSAGEIGQLAQAVGRLITVLKRSDALVYHLAALVESSGEAIISQTLDGTILSWNKGAQRIYGYSAEEMKGKSIAALAPFDGGVEMIRCIQKIQKGETLKPFETVHQARNGRTVVALVRISAILDSTRKVIGASFCAQELTDTPRPSSKRVEENQIA